MFSPPDVGTLTRASSRSGATVLLEDGGGELRPSSKQILGALPLGSSAGLRLNPGNWCSRFDSGRMASRLKASMFYVSHTLYSYCTPFLALRTPPVARLCRENRRSQRRAEEASNFWIEGPVALG